MQFHKNKKEILWIGKIYFRRDLNLRVALAVKDGMVARIVTMLLKQERWANLEKVRKKTLITVQIVFIYFTIPIKNVQFYDGFIFFIYNLFAF